MRGPTQRSTRGRPWLIALSIIAVALTRLPTLMLPACEIPDKTCFGEHITALTEDGGGPSILCSRCLQDQCCDLVGACDEESGCVDKVKAAHACLLERGPSEESRCVSVLGGSETRSRRLYDCMRQKCGSDDWRASDCRLSSCKVEPSVVLLSTPTCDQCFGGSCCAEVNRCYGNRRCKLAIECIVRDCRATLGQEMSAFGAIGDEVLDQVRRLVCEDSTDIDAATVVPNNGLVAAACVTHCLTEFAPFDGGTSDDAIARCLAYDVYACGAKSSCGPACTIEAPVDASSAEDAAIDGGADAADSDASDAATDAASD